MRKYLQQKLNNEKGMTLIELLAVIVILAIIAAIAIPAIGNIIQNSRESALISDAQNIMGSASIYFAENGGDDAVTADELITLNYMESKGKITTATVTKASPDTITFEGTAGNDTRTATDKTKAELSAEGRGALDALTP